MKEKLGHVFEWGVGAYRVMAKNKAVSSIFYIVAGLLQVLVPHSALRLEAGVTLLLLAVYALASFIFVLSDRSERAARGQEFAESLVSGYIDNKKEKAEKHKKIAAKNKVFAPYTKVSDQRLDRHAERLAAKRQKMRSRSKVVLLITYGVMLALAVLMMLRIDVAVHIGHVLMGIWLVVDGVVGLVATLIAIRSRLPVHHKIAAGFISAFAVLLGVLYVVASHETGAIVKQISGALLIIMGCVNGFMLIRNRHAASSVKETVSDVSGAIK